MGLPDYLSPEWMAERARMDAASAVPPSDPALWKLIPPVLVPVAEKALDRQVSGSHYKDLAIQPIEYIHANGLPFSEGCVIKYISRWRSKGGIADLRKAKHFIELLIEMETKGQ